MIPAATTAPLLHHHHHHPVLRPISAVFCISVALAVTGTDWKTTRRRIVSVKGAVRGDPFLECGEHSDSSRTQQTHTAMGGTLLLFVCCLLACNAKRDFCCNTRGGRPKTSPPHQDFGSLFLLFVNCQTGSWPKPPLESLWKHIDRSPSILWLPDTRPIQGMKSPPRSRGSPPRASLTFRSRLLLISHYTKLDNRSSQKR